MTMAIVVAEVATKVAAEVAVVVIAIRRLRRVAAYRSIMA
jgi:hypothetical protein